jgi:hypothetical protein
MVATYGGRIRQNELLLPTCRIPRWFYQSGKIILVGTSFRRWWDGFPVLACILKKKGPAYFPFYSIGLENPRSLNANS